MPKKTNSKVHTEKDGEQLKAAVRTKVEAIIEGVQTTGAIGAPYALTNGLGQFLSAVSPWQEEMDSLDAFVWVHSVVMGTVQLVTPDWKELEEIPPHDRATMVAQIVDRIFAFPKPYTIYFSLPNAEPLAADTQLSPSIAFFTFREPASKKRNKLRGLFDLLSAHDPILRDGTTYLRLQTMGHCAPYSANSPGALLAISKAKRLLSLSNLYLSGLIPSERQRTYGPAQALAHEDGSSESLMFHLEAPPELLAALARTALTGRPPSGLLSMLSNEQTSPIDDLKQYAMLLEDDKKSPELERIRTGLEWAFDSRNTINDTRALIEACIAIEALIGEESTERGLTDRLVDRCSFALGKNFTERQVIAGDFRAIYRLRSQLVHGRAPRLAPPQRKQLRRAQELLDMLLRHEIGMIFPT